MSTESLTLKWGTWKSFNLKSDAAMAAKDRYFAAGSVSAGAMSQRDTPEQKAALCELIDVLDGPIQNDWSGEMMTKEEAKKYVLEYGERQS